MAGPDSPARIWHAGKLPAADNSEIKRRTDVVGIFPNKGAITRLIGAVLLEQSDEWATQHARYMTPETIGSVSENPVASLPALARWRSG